MSTDGKACLLTVKRGGKTHLALPPLGRDMVLSMSTGASSWITAAAVATLISTLTSGGLAYYWERRKLNRSERSAAYAAFLDSFSKRWGAFALRDRAAMIRKRLATRPGADPVAAERAVTDLESAGNRADELRDELYEAYTRIQILAPQAVVEAALTLVRLSDERNRAFKDPVKYKSPANDTRSAALANFVGHARTDLGVKPLDTDRLRTDAARLDRPWWAGGEV